ncbi:hypothetical protein [Ruixingdingia sedimenti]|uniref:Uncharacterized protein n=1 Tax=Ruixingdingia sedimenti TaxID=3073604 RepID=A0ABU1FAX1_9RHOB|nr:hypothetical protein [Xinfangfangia sp. LG-4]MDR5653728.1 hypothetical protein [Xinfangfangia sp. LG-4]
MTEPKDAAGGANRPLVAALIGAMVLPVLARLTGILTAEVLSWAVAVAVAVLNWRGQGLRELYLIGLACALTVATVMFAPDPGAAVAGAFRQGVFLMAFVLMLGLLHEAASSSPAVSETGLFLTRQPATRRFYALYLGTGFMSVLFNLGTISFLLPLVQRGIAAAGPDDGLNHVRERRQISAMLRGFGWAVVWSPTAIAPLALFEILPNVDRMGWSLMGFGIFAVMLLVGAAEDRWSARGVRTRRPRTAPAVPWAAMARFALVCLWLFGMAELVAWATGDTIVFGLICCCPLLMAGWIAAQTRGGPGVAARAVGRRLRHVALTRLPQAAGVAVTLGTSGYIGRLGAAFVPAEALAAALGVDRMPDWLLLALIPPAVSLSSLLGLSPIILAVFFGSLFAALPVLPADPTLLALAISCGWGLASSFSPFATVVLVASGLTGIRPVRMTLVWNLRFNLLASAALFPVFWLLTGGR